MAPSLPRGQGPGGPGGGLPRARVGERTNQARANQTVGLYYAVVAALLQIGCTHDEIGKVGGGNFC